ncbi:phage antirepressor KilAC domain-containing protein [Pontibacter burrus]|uniref:Phage antirepressor protein n=1 Tax=Pontibacter burrus TaxID=2704466 RepID=A0A6B3LQD4_9BACT|nr:phage antirepressor KilAC domain-containing protein [Pontibacter burrus]NEM96198.1 phage antirepressor protein [Pontibacter burrus]
MNLQVFQYQNHPITFNANGEVMVNATQMAKPFGKRPNDFLRAEQTEGFIEALSDRYGISRNAIVQILQGGTTQGTWMHQKLALKFAGWLSPEFELWVYDRIEELLTTGKTELKPLSDDEMISRSLLLVHEKLKAAQQRTLLLEEKNQLNEQVIQQQAPIVEYATKVLNTSDAYPITVIAQDFGLSAVAMNKKLRDLRIIRKVNGVWVLNAPFQGKDYAKTKTHTYTNSEGKQMTSIQMVWTQKGREFLHRYISQKAAA